MCLRGVDGWTQESHHNRGAIREKDAAFIAPAILDSILPFAKPLTLAVYARFFLFLVIRLVKGSPHLFATGRG